MKSYMNTNIDPCTDFYHYACGNWHKHNQLPPDRTSYDTFEILRENLDVVLNEILSEKPSLPVLRKNCYLLTVSLLPYFRKYQNPMMQR